MKLNRETIGSLCCFLTFLLFLTLKLCNVITWSWWWVTAPLWLPVIVMVAITIVFFVCAVLLMFWINRKEG